MRRDTGFQKTGHPLNRLTIGTGTCVGNLRLQRQSLFPLLIFSLVLVAIVNLFTFFAWPHTNYYCITELYSGTLFALFDSRKRIIGGRGDPGRSPQSSGGLPGKPPGFIVTIDFSRCSTQTHRYPSSLGTPAGIPKSSRLADEHHHSVLEISFLFFSGEEALTDPMCSSLW